MAVHESPLPSIGTESRRRRRLSATVATVLTAAAMNLVVAPNAFAAGCGNGSGGHCYAILQSGSARGIPRYSNGVNADLKVSCLAAKPGSFTTFEMWMNINASNSYWVEAGLSAGDIGQGGFQWFWADLRPGQSFAFHFIRWAAQDINIYRNVKIRWVHGTTNWNILFAESVVATSTNNSASNGGTQLGAEVAISTGPAVWGTAKNWRQDNGTSWVAVPVDGAILLNNNAGLAMSRGSSGGFPYINVTTPSKPCGSTPTAAMPQASPFLGTDSEVSDITARTAADLGEAEPHDVQMVPATRGDAVALSGENKIASGAKAPSLLIQARGHFTSPKTMPGQKASALTGDTLRVVVDAATGVVTDYSISNLSGVDLSGLGSVRRLTTK